MDIQVSPVSWKFREGEQNILWLYFKSASIFSWDLELAKIKYWFAINQRKHQINLQALLLQISFYFSKNKIRKETLASLYTISSQWSQNCWLVPKGKTWLTLTVGNFMQSYKSYNVTQWFCIFCHEEQEKHYFSKCWDKE